MKIVLSFWLLYFHQILCLNSNNSRNGRQQFHGQWLTNTRFDTHFGISLDDCMQKCKAIQKCKSVNYIRKSGFCELNAADQTTVPEALQTHTGAIFAAKCDWDFEEPEHCNSCSDTEFCPSDKDKPCQIFGCPPPVPVAGAKILGNLFKVGTNRLYMCSTGVQQVSVCQADGTWSPVTLKCTCGELEIEDANYTVTETDSGITVATISCAVGYVHAGIETVQCNKSTWEWDKLEQVRCVNILVAPWTLVFSTRFDTHFGISLDDCMQKCKAIRKCKSVNYIRKSGFCELNAADQTTVPEALQTHTGAIFAAKCDWDFEEPEHCNSCSDTEFCPSDKDKPCQIFGCPPPVPVAGAKILGNLFKVGTNRLYMCSTGVQQVSVCQADGTWSPVTLKCTCGELEIEDANYTVTETDSGITVATISCAVGYVHAGIETVQCNKSTWEWDKLEQVRCVNILVAPWTLVFRTTHGSKLGYRSLYITWNKKRKRTPGEFRNDEIVDNWGYMKIKRVKVDILNFSGKVAATLVFDGTGTDKWNWFSDDKLIYSSWVDLKTDLSVTMFSIDGQQGKSSEGKDYSLRWSIFTTEKNANDVMTVDCSKTIVWLAIMKSKFYPCDGVLSKHKTQTILIVYSDSENGTTWTNENLKEAREFTVSVLLT